MILRTQQPHFLNCEHETRIQANAVMEFTDPQWCLMYA